MIFDQRTAWFASGVLRLLRCGTPFLFVIVASQPAIAESVAAATETVPYVQPIEDDAASGIENQYQLQVLQRDVMDLRGQLEELTHLVEQMQKTQDDRYLELDRRFQDLKARLSKQPVQGTAATATPRDAATSRTDAAETGDEKTLYETALELIRNRQYDLAITQLQAVIAQYPDGVYAPNAYYWLGEVYAAKPEPDYEKARQALAQVISFFPDHRKVPDAEFKLGKVYYLMGDCDRATDILNQVIQQQQGRTVAKLAEAYLRDKVHCDGR